MNKDQLINLIQTLVQICGGMLAAKGMMDSSTLQAISGGLIALVTWLMTHKWNATPATPAATQPVNIPITKITPLLALTAASGLYVFTACAPLQPGADPIVVRAEQSETVAKGTFDAILKLDNSNRPYFRTNAPGLHKLCEWLRQPQMVEGTNKLPRATALLVSLDDVKLAYKAGRATTNELFTVLFPVESAVGQAQNWLTVTTNQPAQ